MGLMGLEEDVTDVDYVRGIVKKELAVALLQACHIHFTNITICLVDVKFAYMVQVVEPLITLLLTHFMVAVIPAMTHIASLLPVPYGIYLSTSAGISSPVPIVSSQTNMSLALLTAFISVATISARNVLFKGKDSNAPIIKAPNSIWESSVAYWKIASVAALVLFPGYLYSLSTSHSFLFSSNPDDLYLLLRGVTLHVIYNTFSFITLAKMEPVTHSLLNVIKRILTVTISMFYFNAAWIPIQLFGIFLANVGVASYGVINHLHPGVKMDACEPRIMWLVRYWVVLACPVLLYGTLFLHL